MKDDGYQLFRLSPLIWKSVTYEDIVATAQDMEEMCLLKAPFKKFAIEVPWSFLNLLAEYEEDEELKSYRNASLLYEYEMKDKIVNGLVKETIADLYLTGLDEAHHVILKRKNVMEYITIKDDHIVDLGVGKEIIQMSYSLYHILAVLLATKNHKAETTVNRNLMAGKSNKKNAYRKDYPYTTTISIGKITESHVGDGDDPRTVRPHLRRGHIRTQRFGPDRSFEKKIFIEPVFVNASQGWIAKRAAYNVSSKAWSDSRANVS